MRGKVFKKYGYWWYIVTRAGYVVYDNPRRFRELQTAYRACLMRIRILESNELQ